MADREKVIKGLSICGGDDPDCQNCPYYGAYGDGFGCETIMQRDALSLLKAQEQEIQQLKATHISASDNAIACGVIRGGVTINQKAKEITNIKHIEVFNG